MYSLFPALRTVSATFNFKPEHLATVWSRRAVSPRDCSAAFTGLCRVLPAMSLLSYVIRFPGQVGLTGRKTGENNCMDEQKHKLLICKSLVCLVHRVLQCQTSPGMTAGLRLCAPFVSKSGGRNHSRLQTSLPD